MTERRVSYFTAAAAYAGSLIAGVVLFIGGGAWLATMAHVAGGFFPGRDRQLDGRAARARGVVTRCELMMHIHSGRKHPRRIGFTFVDSGGRTRQGTSYTWGGPLRADAEVEVEYLPDDPGCSRIAGMRVTVFPTWLQAPGLAMALVGVGLAVRGSVRTSGRLEILRAGTLAEGEIVEARLGFSHLGSRRLVKVRYGFVAGNAGSMEGSDSVYAHSAPPPGSKITIAYDERDPSANVVYSLERTRDAPEQA